MELDPCNICYQQFDDQNRCPFIFKNCGHTFCKNCINNLITKFEKNNLCALDCPICKKTTDIFLRNKAFETQFIKNFSILDAIVKTKSISECTHPNKSFICLSENCINSNYCCNKCILKWHKNCDTRNFKNANTKKSAFEKAAKIYGLFELEENKIKLQKKVDLFWESLNNFVASFNQKFNKLMAEFSSAKYFEAKNEKDFFCQNEGSNILFGPISNNTSQISSNAKKMIENLFEFNKIMNDEFLSPVEKLMGNLLEQTRNLENDNLFVFKNQNPQQSQTNLKPVLYAKPDMMGKNEPTLFQKNSSNFLPNFSAKQNKPDPKNNPSPNYQQNIPNIVFEYEVTTDFKQHLVEKIKKVIIKSFEVSNHTEASLENSIQSRLFNVLNKNFSVKVALKTPILKNGSTIFIGKLQGEKFFVEVGK